MRHLLILSIAGTRYGLWEDEIVAVRDVPGIHRIPLSPACIAGMSILDDRTVTLADLAVCLGLPPLGRDMPARLLLMSDQEKVAGFVVEDRISRIEASPENVLPMPEYLKTAVVGSCVLHASELMPVININALFGRIQKADREPAMAEFVVPSAAPTDIESVKSVRVFSAGQQVFAAPAAGLEEESFPPGRITKLSLIPPYVKGVAPHDRKVFPLIRLAQLMKLPKAGMESAMIPADLSGAPFGFLVDEDGGTQFSRDFTIEPLPPLAQSLWVPTAARHHGALLPLIDLGMLMSPRHSDIGVPLPDRYHPDSQFPDQFRKEEVVVAEFSLLGARHALPRAEVEDTVPFKPYRSVPNVQPIVAGVAEHKGELLPVLDLATVFGRRSLAQPEWKMIVVRNGDFRALVITESYYGERRLPVDQQRVVPIVLPHSVVYGCYPDKDVVRLILNVEALAVHFDLSLVKSFLGALSKEMQEAPAEIVPALLPEEYMVGEPVVSATVPKGAVAIGADTERLKAEEAAPARQDAEIRVTEEARAETEQAELARREVEDQAGADDAERLRQEAEARSRKEAAEEQARIAAEAQALQEADERERAEEAARQQAAEEERLRLETEERERLEAEARAEAERIELARREAEARSAAEEADRLRQEAEERSKNEAEEHAAEAQAGQEAEERERAEEAARLQAAEEERLRLETEERERLEAEARAEAERIELARREAEEVVREAETIARAGDTEVRGAGVSEAGEEADAEERVRGSVAAETAIREVRREHELPAAVSAPRSAITPAADEPRPKKSRLIAVLIAVALIVLFYLLGDFRKAPVEHAVREEPAAAAGRKVPAPKAEIEEPLVLKVPKGTVMDTEVYEVRKGDTLWHISKRFTGNPFNYPRVAKDNKIANPDLIFPKQKIRIMFEE